MPETFLYIMTGYPYAGKTTLVREIERRFNFPVVSIDDINTERELGLNQDKPIRKKDWDITYKEGFNRLKSNLLEGKTTILDAGNFSRGERDQAREMAKDTGAIAKVIYVNTPLEECKKRWIENRETNERRQVREEDFKQAINSFEPPTHDENVIVYNNSQNPQDWINENL